MKKVFLTSGVVLCLALPAYATTDISSSANSASCVEDTLGVDSGSTEFEAIWNAQSFTVTYSAGSHCSGSYTHTNGATYDSNYTIPAAANSAVTPATGYHFNNVWNTAANGSGTAFTGATPWATASGLTVYSQCEPNVTTVTYSCNGGTGTPGTPASATATYGQSYTYAGAGTCANTGQTFGGWNCGAAGTPKTAGTSETWSIPARTVVQ